MVTIPSPQEPGQRVGSVQTEAANTPFLNIRSADTSAVGRDLQNAGRAMDNLAGQLRQMREDTNIRNAQQELFAWEQQMLDPQTGLASRMGGNAAGVTEEYNASFKAKREEIANRYGSGIGVSGKRALDQLLDGTERRVWRDVADYETRQLEVEAQRQHAATVEQMTDLAGKRLYYGDTAGAAAAMTNLSNQLEDEGMRLGYTGKALTEFVEQGVADAWVTTITNMAGSGQEIEAEAQLKALLEDGIIDETDGRALLNKIAPEAQEKKDTIAATAAFNGTPAPPFSTKSGQPTVDTLLPGLIQVESSGNPNARGPEVKVGSTGRTDRAVGLVQVMERFLGKDYGYGVGVIDRDKYLNDPEYQRETGRRILAAMMKKFNGNVEHALMAYNWGPESVSRWLARGADPSEVPQQTREYVPKVLAAAGYTKRAGTAEDNAVVVDDGLTARDRLMRDHGAGAVKKYDALVSAEYTRDQHARTAIYQNTVAEVDDLFTRGPTVDLDAYLAETPGLRAALGDKLIPLRNYVASRNKGETIATDPREYRNLAVLRDTDPDLFARTDLMEYIDVIDRTTLRGLIDDQARILGEGTQAAGLDVKDIVGDTIEARVPAGIEGGRAFHVDRAVYATREWAKDYEKQTGKRPTDLQMLTFAEKMALGGQFQIEMDTWGGNELTGTDKALDRETFAVAANQIDDNGLDFFLEAGEPMTMTLPTAAGGKPVEVEVSPEIMKEVADELTSLYGRRPDGSEFLTALILRNTDAFNP